MVLAAVSAAVLWRGDGPADQWVVEVHADDDRTYDEPCLPTPGNVGVRVRVQDIELEATSAGGEYNGLVKVGSQADGETLARCYEAHGIEAELRVMTASDRVTWDELRGPTSAP